ncbi:TrkH-domain-containing protein [Parathielavia hyrcaniae]|uniref:TrkH-domain-containing protein n=1 Tax=Parathielavia hyrcaniae TaxID=113614 RepID=A0AAN6PQW2_9PEZI|nr:TrkH-domain-containing protein [Parathielavia hyrcaniae]
MKWLDDFRRRHSEGRLAETVAKIRPYLPPINFITVHYAYFVFAWLFFALVFWGSGSAASAEISFLDSLFMTMSALTSTGLNTVNVSLMSTGQQVVLFLAMILGHPILISLWTVLFRRHIFEKRFRAIVKAERERKLRSGSAAGLTAGISDLLAMNRLKSMTRAKSTKSNDAGQLTGLGSRIPTAPAAFSRPERLNTERDVEAALAPIAEGRTPGARSVAFAEPRPQPSEHHDKANADPKRGADFDRDRTVEIRNFLDEKRTNVGRNGEFFNLTLNEREYLGGVEYRAVEVLVVTVAMYIVLWQLLGAIALGSWMAVHAPEIPAENAQNPWWAGVFLAVSAFSSGGLTLLDAGAAAFQSGYYFVLIVATLLILVGSQASPIFLRFIVWVLSKLLKVSTRDEGYAVWKETFDFILQYPRRVYINMFPARPTWTLFTWLGALLLVDWLMFFLLNFGNPLIESIPLGPRVIDGLFQSASILSAGFAVVSPSSVYFGLQVLWLVKMYASAYPTSITVRGSNVYEERSLGIYAGDEPEPTGEGESNEKQEKSLPAAAGAGLFLTTAISGNHQPPLTPMSAASRASRLSKLSQVSRGGIDKIVGIGKEGTALLGRQLQRRMTGFQGVGIAPAHPRHQKKTGGLLQGTPGSLATSASSSTAGAGSLHSLGDHAAPAQDLVSHHVRSQLSHDVWWIALAFFLVAIIETSHALGDPAAYSLFNMLFEIMSAYANNGVSMGLPTAATSFVGGCHAGTKLVLILVMLRGRHRDLPVALDRAVKLPSMDLDDKEDDDAEIRRAISRTPNLGAQSPLGDVQGIVRQFPSL